MSVIQQTSKFELEGRGTLELRPSQFVTTGGEGSIYRAKDLIIKLYTDQGRMVRENLTDKIGLLAKIKYPSIVAPLGVVRDQRRHPVGFYMPYQRGEPLARVFTNDWRTRSGFSDGDASVVVGKMHETVTAAHQNGAIMIDANELNWILDTVSKRYQPYVIDVDSWAIRNWGAHVIMPSIKDWHAQTFSEVTDWFAWGIVSFQIYTGIHPYKGRLDGYGPGDLSARMKANASVFTKGVRLNKAVRDFKAVPGPLLDWYYETFQNGMRCTPPLPGQKGVAVFVGSTQYKQVFAAPGSLLFEELVKGVGDPVVRVYPCGVVMRRSGTLYDLTKKRDITKYKSLQTEVVPVMGGWLVVERLGDTFVFSYINDTSLVEEPLQVTLAVDDIFVAGDRLFAIGGQGLTEMSVMNFKKPLLVTKKTWHALPESTVWFDGVGVMNALGAYYLIVPYDDDKCAQIRVRELDGLRIIGGRYGYRFASLMSVDDSGSYQRIDVTLSADHTTYTSRKTNADSPELNLTLLPKGVVARIVSDGELIIDVPTTQTEKVVVDGKITTALPLARIKNTVVYIENGDLYSVRMK